MPSKQSGRSRSQKAGGSSQWQGPFYATSYGGLDNVQAATRYGNALINDSPMFKPLQTGTVFPTATLGPVATGSYYMAEVSGFQNMSGPPVPGPMQAGGAKKTPVVYYVVKKGKKAGKEITNPWIAYIYSYAESHGISYTAALNDPEVRKGYTKVSK